MMVACGSPSGPFEGSWHARWFAQPGAFEGVGSDVKLEMYGRFDFLKDSLTIHAYGFPGCLFGADTLVHTQAWEMAGDSLFLLTDQNRRGIFYLIKEKKADNVQLQLMDDIFISLTKN